MQVLSSSQRTGQFPPSQSSVHVQPGGQVHCPLLQLSSQHPRLSQPLQVESHAPPKPPLKLSIVAGSPQASANVAVATVPGGTPLTVFTPR